MGLGLRKRSLKLARHVQSLPLPLVPQPPDQLLRSTRGMLSGGMVVANSGHAAGLACRALHFACLLIQAYLEITIQFPGRDKSLNSPRRCWTATSPASTVQSGPWSESTDTTGGASPSDEIHERAQEYLDCISPSLHHCISPGLHLRSLLVLNTHFSPWRNFPPPPPRARPPPCPPSAIR